MDIDEIEDIVYWNLSFNIPIKDTLNDLNITDPEILKFFKSPI